MSVINIIVCALFLSSIVQAENWDYKVTKITENDTYIIYGNGQENTNCVLDYSNRLISFFDGKSGGLFLIQYEISVTFFFPNGTWYANSTNFDNYIKNNTLKDIYTKRRAEAYRCQPTTTPQGFSNNLAKLLKLLIEGFSSECESFSTAIWVGKVSSDLILTFFLGFENVFGEVSAQIQLDLESLVGFFQGLGNIFKHFDGGIKSLNTTFDIVRFIKPASKSGFDVLGKLIDELSSYFEKFESLIDDLNNQYRFFILVRQLGGNKNGGGEASELRTFIYVIVDIMSVINKELSYANLRTTLKVYYESNSGGKDVEKEWKEAVKILLDSIKKHKLEGKLGDLVKVLQSIRDDKWKFKGVDMSKICKWLVSTKKGSKDSSKAGDELEDLLNKTGRNSDESSSKEEDKDDGDHSKHDDDKNSGESSSKEKGKKGDGNHSKHDDDGKNSGESSSKEKGKKGDGNHSKHDDNDKNSGENSSKEKGKKG